MPYTRYLEATTDCVVHIEFYSSACSSSVSVRVRNSSADCCNAGEFVIMSPAWKWNSRSGNASYLMPMPIIEGCKCKITVCMWNTAWRGFCHANILMSMARVIRSNPGELVDMHRSAIPSSNIQVMGVMCVRIIGMNQISANRYLHRFPPLIHFPYII
jgi:hypothetical protein